MNPQTKEAKFKVNPIKVTAKLHQNINNIKRVTVGSHTHDECEIYVNLTGNVSFMVENRIYKVERGDVIITRPNEAHHCILHSLASHDHFHITFSCQESDSFLERFFAREKGEKNLISLLAPQKEKLLKLCGSIVESENVTEKYISFYSLIGLLSEEKTASVGLLIPSDIKKCLSYIEKNISLAISLNELANYSHTTISTLQRRFKKHIGLSPYAYIQSYRLSLAASLLEKGASVTSAAQESGFSDISHFISLFKKEYKKTPLQFQKDC